MCNEKPNKVACTHRQECNNNTLLNEAKLARKKANFMCSDGGKKYLLRLYTNGHGTCLGNQTGVNLWRNNHISCKTTHLSNIHSLSSQEQCNKLNAARNCDSNYAASICTDLARWPLDRGWKAFFRVFYNHCLDHFSPAKWNFPN
ncbi:hypothetical protein RRG08_007293 [Elysia crispata]|uniref:Uncharacterized protein n=1 Tax=Elysia crispata TaxID=231223 RepID=A0AAE1AW54_9GAST|nr:hypothetical protein RRG08_007293 [Elysia crispata]